MLTNYFHAFFCYFNVYSLEEGGVVTECSIKTHEAVETLDFEFYGSNVVNKIIMKVITLACTCWIESDHVNGFSMYFSAYTSFFQNIAHF